MINTLTFLHFCTFLIYFYLTVYLLSKNPKATLNRVSAAFLSCFTLMSFAFTFLHIPGTLKDTALLFSNVAALGWIPIASFFLWFAFIFTENKKILKTRIFYFIIFSLPLFFLYQKCNGHLMVDYIKKPWGWIGVWANNIWSITFFSYFLIFTATSLYILYYFSLKTKELIKKKQAQVIFFTTLVSLIILAFAELVFPRLFGDFYPNLDNIVTFIWAGGLVYAMIKYKFMSLTPGYISEKIISTMADGLLLLDENKTIITANSSLMDLSSYREDELKGRTMDFLFPEQKACQSLLEKIYHKEINRNIEFVLKTKNGEKVPVLISSSPIIREKEIIIGIVCIIKDIREIKHAERELRKEKRLFDTFMDYIPDSIYFKDNELKFVRVNRVKAEHSGRTPEEMVGLTDFDLFSEKVAKKTFLDDTEVMTTGNPIIGKLEKIIRLDKKSPYWDSVTKVPWYDNNGQIIGLVGISRDVSQYKKAADRLRKLSRIDALTGSYNHRYGLELIERQIKLSNRNKSPLLLVFFDIDNFKQINDRYGHLEGDQVLRQVGSLLQKSLREVDIISRIGGDEFLLAFPGSSLQNIDQIKKRIFEAINNLNNKIKIEKNYKVQISIGFSEYLPEKPKKLSELIKIADQEMYKEKHKK